MIATPNSFSDGNSGIAQGTGNIHSRNLDSPPALSPFDTFMTGSPIQLSTSWLGQASTERDIIAELLADKRSEGTRIAYAKDLKNFFQVVANSEPSPAVVAAFLKLDRHQAFSLVLKYKAHLIAKGLKEATINRRLAAIKSLVCFSRKLGRCDFTLEDVKAEKVRPYRDTRGIDLITFKRVLAQCDRTSMKGKRDYAILHLLWSNALRRSELCKTNIKDFDPDTLTLSILGKGRGTQREIVTLGNATVDAILIWLNERKCLDVNAPLFCSLSRYEYGHRLSGEGLRKVIDGYCKAAGINRKMSVHRLRHSSITHALDATDGNVRKVQKLSRHAKIETLMIYDDNREDIQGELSSMMGNALED
jgi:integrase/recombinase XerC